MCRPAQEEGFTTEDTESTEKKTMARFARSNLFSVSSVPPW
jgi:hypothetical protein